MSMHVRPATLAGSFVRLEPLQPRHAAGLLLTAGGDPTTWDYLLLDPCASELAMEQFISSALEEQERGAGLPFALVDPRTDQVIGSTRYWNISAHDYGLEIGWTWLAPWVRRTGVNTECKYMLLRYAFEELKAIRVQLKTDSRNFRSQKAIERIGAVREGVLRNHMLMRDGYHRDSVFFSIIDTEWPAVKNRLETMMDPLLDHYQVLLSA